MRLHHHRVLGMQKSLRLLSVSSIGGCDDEVDSPNANLLGTSSVADASSSDAETVEQVTMMRFDTLGPAVVTTTGKVRFFEDWEGKTEKEREDILAIIIPRNKERLQQLQNQEIDCAVDAKVREQKEMESNADEASINIQNEFDENIELDKSDPFR